MTFTTDKTYSIVSDDGGVATGSYTNTVTTISTTVAPITDLTGSGCTISFTGVNGGITAPTVLAGGAGYSVGQVLAVTDGGTGGQVAVATVSAGAVTAVTLISGGSGYATGAVTGKGTTLVGLKISTCFTKDFLNGVTYTITADGKTLTIPVCPITFTKQ
ncbi:MAG: hypothetical protein HZA04_06210 [Nitrospinae bacterium]|nr:hypothetical protein [Nitrospinota bacterium]